MTRKPKRPNRRIARAARARLGYFIGVLLVATGVALQLGVGWGFVVVGVALVAYMVLLYDVDEPQPYDPDEEVRFR